MKKLYQDKVLQALCGFNDWKLCSVGAEGKNSR